MGKIKEILHKIWGTVYCSECSRKIFFFQRVDLLRLIKGKIYCAHCARRKFKICYYCDKVVDKVRKVEGRKICDGCFDKRTHKCDECGKTKLSEKSKKHNNRTFCRDCYQEFCNRYFDYVDLGEKKQLSKTFLKNPRRGYCGVEIECLNSNRDANCFIKKELKNFRFSQGKDGSLSRGGVEFRSIPMNGDLLFNSITSFCKALRDKKYRVDSSCGLHIHIEVKQQLKLLKKLYLFYLRFEPLFFSMLPKSRRGIRFCKEFGRYYQDSVDDIMKIKTLDEFGRMLYESKFYKTKMKYHGYKKRYCWANLHSIFYRGTLEIRSHSGTINSTKIINWIMIHQRVLEFLKEKSLKEIGNMKTTKKAFLGVFPKPLQNYIKRRWKTFIRLEEEDLKAGKPYDINAKPIYFTVGDRAGGSGE